MAFIVTARTSPSLRGVVMTFTVVSSTATTKKQLLKDKHGDSTSRRAIQPLYCVTGYGCWCSSTGEATQHEPLYPICQCFFFEAPINKPWGYPSGCMLSEKSVFDEAKLGAPEIFRANLMYRITRRRFVLQFS